MPRIALLQLEKRLYQEILELLGIELVEENNFWGNQGNE